MCPAFSIEGILLKLSGGVGFGSLRNAAERRSGAVTSNVHETDYYFVHVFSEEQPFNI